MGGPRTLARRTNRVHDVHGSTGAKTQRLAASLMVAGLAAACGEGGGPVRAPADGAADGGMDAGMETPMPKPDAGSMDAGPTGPVCSDRTQRQFLLTVTEGGKEATHVVHEGNVVSAGGRSWTVGWTSEDGLTLTNTTNSVITTLNVADNSVTVSGGEGCLGTILECAGFSVGVRDEFEERADVPAKAVLVVRGENSEFAKGVVSEGGSALVSPDMTARGRVVTANDARAFLEVVTDGASPVVDEHRSVAEGTNSDLANGRAAHLLSVSEQVQQGCHESGAIVQATTGAGTSGETEMPVDQPFSVGGTGVVVTVLEVVHEPSENGAPEKQFARVRVQTPNEDQTHLVCASSLWEADYGIRDHVEVTVDAGTVRVLLRGTFVRAPAPETADGNASPSDGGM